MEHETTQSSRILSERCKVHSDNCIEFIHITPEVNTHKICFECLQDNEIPIKQVIKIKNLLESNKQTVLKNYPPLTNPSILPLLTSSPTLEYDQLDMYFNDLISKFQEAIQVIRLKQKATISQLIESKEMLRQNYYQFEEISKLKNAVLSLSGEEEIHKVLKEAFSKTEENSIKLQSNVKELNKLQSKLDLGQLEKIQQQILDLVQSIDFWNSSSSILTQEGSLQLLNQINLIPSTKNNSKNNLQITKNSLHQIEAKTVMETCYQSTFYFDFILNPDLKYKILLEMDLNYPLTPYFAAGLMTEINKNELCIYDYRMAYHEANAIHGVGKILKGQQLCLGTYATNLKKKLEIRICLKDRLFKFGSFPDYNNVLGIDDPLKIDPTCQYRLGFQLYAPKELMRILSVETVLAFDDQM